MDRRRVVVELSTIALGNMNIRFPAHHCKGFTYYDERMPWCNAFVVTMLDWAGILSDIFGREQMYADCDEFRAACQLRKRYDRTKRYGGGAYKPTAGDVAFLSSKHDPNDITHVAIVYEFCDDGSFRIIEGNYNDQMHTRVLKTSDPYVIGFGNMGV